MKKLKQSKTYSTNIQGNNNNNKVDRSGKKKNTLTHTYTVKKQVNTNGKNNKQNKKISTKLQINQYEAGVIRDQRWSVLWNRCPTVWNGTVSTTNADSTTNSRGCTRSTIGWLTSTSPASAKVLIPGQEEPSCYASSTLTILLCSTLSSPTL